MTDTPARIGWIGTGRMGFQLCRRLLDAGHEVAVYNRTRAKAEPLQDHGASPGRSPDRSRGVRHRVLMVSASDDLHSVMTGDGGLLTDASRTPRIIVDSSTVSAEASEVVRSRAEARTVLLAAPVSGNPKSSRRASSPSRSRARGTRSTRSSRALAFGRGVTYVGDGEVARLVKICHNVFLGVVTQSLAEITVLAERGGISRQAFLEFLNDSVMGSTFTRYKSPALVNLDFSPTFTMALLRKDFDLGLAAAHDLQVPMPVAAPPPSSWPPRSVRDTATRTSPA